MSRAALVEITLTCVQTCVSGECGLSCSLPDNLASDAQSEIGNMTINSSSHTRDSESKSLTFTSMTDSLPQNTGFKVTRIEKLQVSNSGLRQVSRREFRGMGHLRVLNLESNRIEAIPHDAFHNLTSLEVLAVNDNSISYLPRDLLSRLKNLREFYAEFNKIERLEPGTFHENSKLQVIHLNDNDLVSVKENFLDKLQLQAVDLRRNREFCRKCEVMEKKVRDEKLVICYRDRYYHEKAWRDDFEACVDAKTAERDDLSAITSPCKKTKVEFTAMSQKKYETCTTTAVANGMNLDTVRMIDLCIYELRSEENHLQGNYESCMQDKVKNHAGLKVFLSGCYGKQEDGARNVTELFNSCVNCGALNSEVNVRMCELRFNRDHDENVVKFQKDVNELF
jgi:hypothetical protein